MRRLLVLLTLLLLSSLSFTAVLEAQTQTVYTVQPNDSLYRISLRFGVSISAITTANNIVNPNLIFVGQQLIIPAGGITPTAVPPTGVPGTPVPPTVTPPVTAYVVVRGDTLARIAIRFGTTVTAIVRLNNLPNANLIYTGQRLNIPSPGTVIPPTGVPPTGVPPTAIPPTVTPPVVTVYVVVPGDTLARIAARFGLSITAIAQANGITNPNLIFVGQRLNIPTGGTVITPTPPPVTPGGPTTVPATTVPATLVPGPGTVGGFELGGQVFGFAYPNEMRGAGMTWAKIQIRWNGSDPASIAQGAIDSARSRGFRVLLSIAGDPAQLAANQSGYFTNFSNFLGGVAALSPDGIEVWNEQNIDREWPRGLISPSSYTQLLQLSFAAIKRANPNVLVISGAPAPTGFFGGACTGNGCDDNAFIRGMAAAGAAASADCIGIHYNEGILSPDATSGDPRGNSGHYTRYFPSMVNLYASVFPNKPLCFTEIGYVSPEGFGPLPAGFEWGQNTSIQEQAEWLARATVLARQSGRIRLMVVWNVDATVYNADPQAGYAIVRNGSCLACITLGSVMGVR